MYVLTNGITLKRSLWNPICLRDEAEEIMVRTRPTEYGKYISFFHFAVVSYTFSGVAQRCAEHEFYTWKGIGMRKKGDLNFWISSCVDI